MPSSYYIVHAQGRYGNVNNNDFYSAGWFLCLATGSEAVARWRGRRVEARVAGEEVGMRIIEEVESARDGRVCAWRSGPRAQVSGEPRGDIPEVCGATRAGSWGEVCRAFEGVDDAAKVAARSGGAARAGGWDLCMLMIRLHVH